MSLQMRRSLPQVPMPSLEYGWHMVPRLNIGMIYVCWSIIVLSARRIKNFITHAGGNFSCFRREGTSGLGDNCTFVPTPIYSVKTGTRIFGVRFVEELKTADLGMLIKSCFVAHNYRNLDASSIASKAPSVQRFSQRLILSLA